MTNSRKPPQQMVRLAVVGDILLSRGFQSQPLVRDSALMSSELRHLVASCDLVVGNLECTLPGDGRHVPTEPRVVASPDAIDAVIASGIHVVTLANNHMFDCLEPGFLRLRRQLDAAGIRFFGAGMDLTEAESPVIVKIGATRIAFLGAVDGRSGPYQFAAPGQFGVAPLNLPRLLDQVTTLRRDVDHVLVSLHWGEERFLIPSPIQVEQARALIDAGASMVLGHHPHVLQGLEWWHGCPIIYSLGNFIADDVPFSNGDLLRWNRTERTGCVLLAELHSEGVTSVRQVPTYDDGRLARVDGSRFGQKHIDRAARALARGVTLRRYRWEHLRIKTLLPILAHLRWSKLKDIRPRNLANALRHFLSAWKAR